CTFSLNYGFDSW
nr:immunoglobulin heavy chain junction region [Macaca mulatta]